MHIYLQGIRLISLLLLHKAHVLDQWLNSLGILTILHYLRPSNDLGPKHLLKPAVIKHLADGNSCLLAFIKHPIHQVFGIVRHITPEFHIIKVQLLLHYVSRSVTLMMRQKG